MSYRRKNVSLTEALNIVSEMVNDAAPSDTLLDILRDGNVSAEGRHIRMSPGVPDFNSWGPVSPDWWSGSIDWSENRVVRQGEPPRRGVFGTISLEPYEAIEDIQISTAELKVAIVGGDLNRNGNKGRNAGAPRGRPPKYNWPEFYAEIAVLADLDGLPERQAELERQMAEWCQEKWGQEPSESEIRKHVSPIYNHPRKQS